MSFVHSSSMKHLGSFESTQEAGGYASSNSNKFFALFKLPMCFISRWMYTDIWINCKLTTNFYGLAYLEQSSCTDDAQQNYPW